MKISLIGAGQIGGTLAHLIALKNLASEVELIDINGDAAKGKALDISQLLPIIGNTMTISGGSEMERLTDSSVVIVTAGIPRKPGMTREELLETNASVMMHAGKHIKKFAPNAFVVVVTNPLDAMVWALKKSSGLSSAKVVGMAGVLDSSRMNLFVAQEFNVSVRDVNCMVLGSHGDLMVPLTRYSTVGGVPLSDLLLEGKISKDRVDAIVERTKQGGAEVVALLKNGSAYYTPAASALQMAESYIKDQKRILVCSVCMQGHYQVQDDIFSGVPVLIGKNGVENVIELNLNNDETAMFNNSINATRELVASVSKFLP